jgi:DeoR/GlpR family transcriptional regulator of sugar metabolism
LVADSSKFGRQSLTHLCSLAEVDHLVVDDGISEEWRNKVTTAGIHLLVAGED